MEFVADELEDWAVHCHESATTWGRWAMRYQPWSGRSPWDCWAKLFQRWRRLHVDGRRYGYMGDGNAHSEPNTTPMMTGYRSLDRWKWAACLACSKGSCGTKPGDYSGSGWFKHPEGTVAKECTPGR